MDTRNKTLGGLGLAVAALFTLSVTACDPYQAAKGGTPVVLGVSVFDTSSNGIPPPDSTVCSAAADQAPYPQVSEPWANVAYPGLCNPLNIANGFPSVCPVNCYPPRVGPGFAPLFLGTLGATYTTSTNGTYTYDVSTAYTLGAGARQFPVPPIYIDSVGDEFTYGQIQILFNKLLDPTTVQPNVNDPLARPTGTDPLRVLLDGVPAPGLGITYQPNSDVTYWGASIMITSDLFENIGSVASPVLVPVLKNNATYQILGTVVDQQGNPVSLNVTVVTGANIDDTPPAPAPVKQ